MAPTRSTTTDLVRKEEVEQRIREGKGPVTPEGEWKEVPPGRRGSAELDQLPRVLEDLLRRGRGGGGVQLHQVGGLYDQGFRHDPERSAGTLAEYCLNVATRTNNLPMRVDMLENYMNEYEADGLLINSIKSCNSSRRVNC